MRRSSRLTQNQAYIENDAGMGPNIKKSRPDNKIVTNIATLDNGTMVETLKYLNYMQLAKSSLVAKRFSNLIRTHRHSLALLDVEHFSMVDLNLIHLNCAAAAVKIFNKELSPDAYAEWVVRNGYSNKIIHEVVKTQCKQYSNKFYEMRVYYKDSNQSSNGITSVFFTRKKLSYKNWALFQHFVRLLTDPFVYFHYLKLIPQIDVSFLNLLAGSINPCHNRLQCDRLDFYLQGNVQKLLGWIKDYVHCTTTLYFSDQSGSHYDEALLDLFMTGAHCTSEIYFSRCDISSVVGAFLQLYKLAITDLNQPPPRVANSRALSKYIRQSVVGPTTKTLEWRSDLSELMWNNPIYIQKFLDLKSCDENKMVEYIHCNRAGQVVELLKTNYAKFITKEEKFEFRTVLSFELMNNDIGKQLQITTTAVHLISGATDFLLEIKNL